MTVTLIPWQDSVPQTIPYSETCTLQTPPFTDITTTVTASNERQALNSFEASWAAFLVLQTMVQASFYCSVRYIIVFRKMIDLGILKTEMSSSSTVLGPNSSSISIERDTLAPSVMSIPSDDRITVKVKFQDAPMPLTAIMEVFTSATRFMLTKQPSRLVELDMLLERQLVFASWDDHQIFSLQIDLPAFSGLLMTWAQMADAIRSVALRYAETGNQEPVDATVLMDGEPQALIKLGLRDRTMTSNAALLTNGTIPFSTKAFARPKRNK